MTNKETSEHCSLTPESLISVKGVFHRLTSCRFPLILKHNPWISMFEMRSQYKTSYVAFDRAHGYHILFPIGVDTITQQQIICHLNVLWYDECHPNVTSWIPPHYLFLAFDVIICTPQHRHRPEVHFQLTLSPAWIRHFIHHKVSDEVINPFPRFNGGALEVWINNFIR